MAVAAVIGIERVGDRADVDVHDRVGGGAERVADPLDLLRRRQAADDIVVARVVGRLSEGGRGRGERRHGDDKLTQGGLLKSLAPRQKRALGRLGCGLSCHSLSLI